jgi:hypothetical protein
MGRKATPDILAEQTDIMGDLMGTTNKATKDDNHIAIKQESGETTLQNSKEIKRESNKAPASEPILSKEKTTFNLSVSTLNKLEDTWMSLRRKLKDKGRITKTLIVERAIELAIAELETKGNASALFQDLSNQ